MAETPARKRPVSATRAVAPKRTARVPGSGFRVPSSEPLVEQDPPSQNYALRLTEALDAISAAQGTTPAERDEPKPRAAERGTRNAKRGTRNPEPGTVAKWLKALDKMPPIRPPIGPPIPWRLGLPMLVGLVVVFVVVGRPTGRADAQGVRLPAQETYAVQQEAPLFAQQGQSAAAAVVPGATPAGATVAPALAPAAAMPIGVQDPGGLGFDFLDVGFKLVAVLALAYGSLVLLKRAGLGGAGTIKPGGTVQGMRIVSTLALAPNRSVHVLKVPGGKTLLVGATPSQVNLIADLGDLAEDETPEASSFFDVLKGKIN